MEPTQAIELRSQQTIVTPATLEFTAEQRQMIRNTYASGAAEAEFAVLMEVAKARRLNPLLGQIHFVKRWTQERGEVWSFQVSIDGFRALAERTGKYDGQDEPDFEYDEGAKVPKLARVKIYRKDWSRAAVGVAHFTEYAQYKKDGQLTKMWATKPHIMLAKCAEALAFRKAFPEDTSGLYAPEEMGDDNAPRTGVPRNELVTEDEEDAAKKTQKVIDAYKAAITAAKNETALAQAVADLANQPELIKKAVRSDYAARKKWIKENAGKVTDDLVSGDREPGSDDE